MKVRLIVICFFVVTTQLLISACDTKNNIDPVYKEYFIRYYGEDGDQEGNDFFINSDGTVVILGTSSFGITKKVYLVKVDAEGNEIWKKTFNSPLNELAKDIELITNGPDAGNFVILSNVEKNDTDLDIRLTIVNQNGDSLKGTLFNQLISQEGKTVTPLTDGGYYVSGTTTDTDPNNTANAALPPTAVDQEDLLVIRMQSDFSYIASDVSRIGGSYTGSANKIFQDGTRFYFAGHSDELTGIDPKVPLDPPDNVYESNFLFRSFTNNPSGVASLYAGSKTLREEITSIARSSSGLFMAIGTQTDNTGTNKQLYAATITNNFEAVQLHGVIDAEIQREGAAVAPAGTTKFLVVANEINAALNRDIYLTKMDILFNKDFEVKFGAANNDDVGCAVAELPSGDILVLGTMQITNQKKIALIKLKANGEF